MPKNQPLKVFISYSHKDKNLKEKLERHLAALKSLGEVALWHDQEVEAGTEWEPQIKAALEEADILLLLVSSDFIASEHINNVELKAEIIIVSATQAERPPSSARCNLYGTGL